MCRLGSYFAAFVTGMLVALTIDVLAHPSIRGFVVRSPPVQERSAVSQTIDRRHKTDRLMPPNKTTHDVAPPRAAPPPPRPILVVTISRSGQHG